MNIERLHSIINGFSGKRVLVVGDVMLDHYCHGTVRRISTEAPVPIFEEEYQTFTPGGAANVACNLYSLGAVVNIVGAVGEDWQGYKLRYELASSGINIDWLMIDENRRTTSKMRYISTGKHRQQQVLRVDRETVSIAVVSLTKRLVCSIREMEEKIDAIFVSDYAKGVVNYALMDAVREVMRRKLIPVMVDPKGRNFHKYHGVTVISPNEDEAIGAMSSDVGIDHCGVLSRVFDINQVFVTRSDKGVVLFEYGGRVTEIPACAKEVVDVSGAGDTTASVYLLSLISGASPQEAAYLGNMAGGIVVGKPGVSTLEVSEILKKGVSDER